MHRTPSTVPVFENFGLTIVEWRYSLFDALSSIATRQCIRRRVPLIEARKSPRQFSIIF